MRRIFIPHLSKIGVAYFSPFECEVAHTSRGINGGSGGHQTPTASRRPSRGRWRAILVASHPSEMLSRSFPGPRAGKHPSKRTRASAPRHVRRCHVWTAPCWQELSSRLQHWSVQPCVRPLDAVHLTAGHNALRGSGPGQKPAFDNNAMAQVGCPDRRIDRLCITCCSLLQPSHHAGCPARSRLRRKRDGLPVTLALSHHGPGHSGKLVGKRDGGDLGRSPGQQCREPGAVFGAVDLGIADDGECTDGGGVRRGGRKVLRQPCHSSDA